MKRFLTGALLVVLPLIFIGLGFFVYSNKESIRDLVASFKADLDDSDSIYPSVSGSGFADTEGKEYPVSRVTILDGGESILVFGKIKTLEEQEGLVVATVGFINSWGQEYDQEFVVGDKFKEGDEFYLVEQSNNLMFPLSSDMATRIIKAQELITSQRLIQDRVSKILIHIESPKISEENLTNSARSKLKDMEKYLACNRMFYEELVEGDTSKVECRPQFRQIYVR